jgi:hypothetical protein
MNTDSTSEVPVDHVETPPCLVNEITRATLNFFAPIFLALIPALPDSDFGFQPSRKFVVMGGLLARPAWLFTLLVTILTPWRVKGDGGVVQLCESRGPFSVTVFANPETAPDGFTDVSVLVQWKNNGEVVLDADVTLALDFPNAFAMDRSDPLCGVSPPGSVIQSADKGEPLVSVPATHDQASNKLLYAAALKFNSTGRARLHVNVVRGVESAPFDCPLPVTQTSAKLTLLWPYLAFPPIAIMAFALNQWLRRDSLEKGFASKSPPPLIHAKPRALMERTSKFCFAKL